MNMRKHKQYIVNKHVFHKYTTKLRSVGVDFYVGEGLWIRCWNYNPKHYIRARG